MRGPLAPAAAIDVYDLQAVAKKSLRVQVFRDKGLHPYTTKNILKRLKRSGYRPSGVKVAKVKRKKTVIYFGKGYKKQAQTLASSIRGGADLKSRNWASKFPIVLALGLSAGLKSPKDKRLVLLANPALVKKTLSGIAKQLKKAGYTIVRTGKSKKKRKKTAIYASEGYTTLAKRLAKLLPGGAKVHVLTWRSRVGLVVALGTSAK